jgi:hypothetical protein
MFTEKELKEFDLLDSIDLKRKMDDVAQDFHAYKQAEQPFNAGEKLYELLQLYHLKSLKKKIDRIDQQQINILCQLYKQTGRKYKLVNAEPPDFNWRNNNLIKGGIINR